MAFKSIIIMKIKQKIYNILNSFLVKRGYSLISTEKNQNIINHYAELTQSININNGIISLVFSKDRAMQLNAFLESYFQNISNNSKMFILYKVSNTKHKKSYDDLKLIYQNLPVVFIEESNFRKQLISTLSETPEDKIILYVDDMIFTHKFDYNYLKRINPYKKIVSLSRGKDLTYSSVLLKELNLPKFTDLDNSMLQFSWDEIKEFSDWTYPLGVSGYMFATKELLAMLKTITFKAPNSLEGALQVFLPLFKNRLGVCTENAISVCIHANLVQTEVNNPILGEFSVEELLEKWNEGFQINLSEFYNKSMIITQEQKYSFNVR